MPDRGSGASAVRPPATASRLLSTGQKVLAVLAVLGLCGGFAWKPRATATVLVAAAIGFYLCFAVLKLVVTLAGRHHRPLLMGPLPHPSRLPHYGVLLPVHKEANMLRRLVT